MLILLTKLMFYPDTTFIVHVFLPEWVCYLTFLFLLRMCHLVFPPLLKTLLFYLRMLYFGHQKR